MEPTPEEVIQSLTQQKNNAYAERDKLLALVCAIAVDLGHPCELWQHEGEDWEDDWRNIVALNMPTGWCTWHIHDSELYLFDWLPKARNKWDGHTTEEKYKRVENFVKQKSEKNQEILREVEQFVKIYQGDL